MPRFLETVTLGEIAVLAAFLAALLAFLRKAIPAMRKASRLVDDVVGVPESEPGRGDGRPGVMDRLAAVEKHLGQVADSAGAAAVQLHPNGGSSARDQIDGLTRAVARIEEHLTEQDAASNIKEQS
ncbi:MAG TPA: hypothetical protein VLJ88_01660 [Propionibacteriaceae bacterium]|nr:hypothetical protein [Propionibacteriaceae bacterium]